MQIKSIEIKKLEIPFRTSFKHASAERSFTSGILVVARSTDGSLGIGESCPREYVSAESIESCIEFFIRNKSTFVRFNTISAIKNWVESESELIDKNPAAWCAIELALLDLIAASEQISIEKLLGTEELKGNFQYSAILGITDNEQWAAQVQKYQGYGFKTFKLKLSGDLEFDKQRINDLLQKIPEADIRLDANNLWKTSEESIKYLNIIDKGIKYIEEPLSAFDYKGCLEIAKACQMKIILDESFLNMHHFDDISGLEEHFAINLRISKMGGLIRSMKIAKTASERKIDLIIGAQVGETSVLSRAALCVSNAFRNNILYREGAFGTLLLNRDICSSHIQFGLGGSYDPILLSQSNRHGFQLDYDENFIQELHLNSRMN